MPNLKEGYSKWFEMAKRQSLDFQMMEVEVVDSSGRMACSPEVRLDSDSGIDIAKVWPGDGIESLDRVGRAQELSKGEAPISPLH
jgi:hypothetical protein